MKGSLMSAINSPKTAGTALLDRPAPGSALDPAQHKDCFATRLREIEDVLDALDRGEYDWALDEDMHLPPKTALDYCRKEAENIARLLSFRAAHPSRGMIPSPTFRPYGEEGEIRLEWCSKADSLSIKLVSEGSGLLWRCNHCSFTGQAGGFRKLSITEDSLWGNLNEAIADIFTR